MAQESSPAGQEWKPEPAETFHAEFGGEKTQTVTRSMMELGFRFVRSVGGESDKQIFEGIRDDGTTVTVIFTRGAEYRSPKDIADAEAAETGTPKENEH